MSHCRHGPSKGSVLALNTIWRYDRSMVQSKTLNSWNCCCRCKRDIPEVLWSDGQTLPSALQRRAIPFHFANAWCSDLLQECSAKPFNDANDQRIAHEEGSFSIGWSGGVFIWEHIQTFQLNRCESSQPFVFGQIQFNTDGLCSLVVKIKSFSHGFGWSESDHMFEP